MSIKTNHETKFEFIQGLDVRFVSPRECRENKNEFQGRNILQHKQHPLGCESCCHFWTLQGWSKSWADSVKLTDALGWRKETAGVVSSKGKPWLWEPPRHTHAWHPLLWPLVPHSVLQRLETVLPLLYGQAFLFHRWGKEDPLRKALIIQWSERLQPGPIISPFHRSSVHQTF